MFQIASAIDSIVKEVWNNDIKDDYENGRLRREGSLQCSLYYHLRRKIGEQYLTENNLFIYAEFGYFDKEVDLAIVHIVGETITPVALFELKYKNSANGNEFYKDVEKVIQYINQSQDNALCKHYLCFIQEAEFEEMSENFSWLSKEQAKLSKGKITELTGGLFKPSNNTVYWTIVEH